MRMRRSSFASAVVLLAVMGAVGTANAQATASSASASPGDAEHPPPSTRWKLVLGGAATTAGFYALAQPFSYAWPDAPGGMDLRIPVLGPWMALADTGCAADQPGCSKALIVARAIITAIDGLGQVGGLGIAAEGIFLTTQDEAPAPKPSAPKRPASPEPEKIFMLPVPVGQSGVGLGMIGVF